MPRQYNRTNYMKVDPSQMNKADLEKLIYNIASTVNARIDAAKKLAKADELLEIFLDNDTNEMLAMTARIKQTDPQMFTKSGKLKKRVRKIAKTQGDLEDIANNLLDIVTKAPATQLAKSEVKVIEEEYPDVIKSIRKGNKLTLEGLKFTVKRVAHEEITDEENPNLAYSAGLVSEAIKLYKRDKDLAAKEYLDAVGFDIAEKERKEKEKKIKNKKG